MQGEAVDLGAPPLDVCATTRAPQRIDLFSGLTRGALRAAGASARR